MRDLRRLGTGAVLASTVAALLTVAGCAGGGTGDASPPHQAGKHQHPHPQGTLTPAAEPGSAPPLATPPAGDVVTLPGGGPWGIVVDDADHLVAVALRGPGRLALVDTTTHAVHTITTPGAARHLHLAGPAGPLLFPSESNNALYELDLPSGKVRSRVPTGRQPHDAVRSGDEIFFSDEVGGYLGVIRHGRQIRALQQPVQPGGITVAGGRVAVVDVQANTLDVYDIKTLKLVASLPAGQGPDHVQPLGKGHVAVSDVRGHALYTYDLTGTPHQLGRVSVPGRPFGIASDPQRHLLYASLSNTNQLIQFHVHPNGTLADPITRPTVRQPNSLDVDPATGTVYVAGNQPARLDILPRTTFH